MRYMEILLSLQLFFKSKTKREHLFKNSYSKFHPTMLNQNIWNVSKASLFYFFKIPSDNDMQHSLGTSRADLSEALRLYFGIPQFI